MPKKETLNSSIAVRPIFAVLIFAMLAFCLLSASASAATVTLASESFDSGSMPAGWTTDGWSYETSDNQAGTGGYVTSEMDALLRIGMAGASLYSPEIDLHGVDNAYLAFNSTEQHASLLLGSDWLFVDMRADGGEWQTIWEGSGYDPRVVLIQLPSSAMGHKAQLRFYYQPTGLLGLLTHGECQVDSVKVFTTNTAGMAQFDPAAYTVDETDSNVVLTVTRAGGSSGAASLDYATSDGTAVTGANYVATSGTVTFAAGQSSADIIIPIKDDGPDNGAKAFSVAISNPSGGMFLGAQTTATVTVNDVTGTRRPGQLQFSKDTYNTYYTSPGVTLTVDRVNGTAGTVAVECIFVDFTAKNGVNYIGVPTTLAFGPGETSRTLTVPIINDGSGNVNFQVWLMNPTNGATQGFPAIATVSIGGANPGGVLQFSPPIYSVLENKDNVTLTVTRGAGTAGAVAVRYQTSDGTAVAGTNYGATGGILSFNDSESVKAITVPVLSDGAGNGDKTFAVTLSSPAGGADLALDPTATVTVRDINSNGPGVISLSTGAVSADETDPGVKLTVTRGPSTNGTVAVDYATADGTAIAGTNYAARSGTLALVDGQMSADVVVPLMDDGPGNGDKAFSFTISNPAGGALLSPPTTATVTVKDVPAQPDRGTFQFKADNYTVLETATNMSLTIERAGGSKGAASIECKFIDVSAVNGVNYRATNTTVDFASGESSKAVVVNILSDGPNNGDRVFWAWLMNPTNGTTLGFPVTATVTVLDDPGQAGDFQFSTTEYEVDETRPSLDVVVTRVAGSPATSVDYASADGTAVAGTNYGAVSGTLTFAAGQTSAIIAVPIMDDGANNGNKQFTITLSNAVGGTIGTPKATVTVRDVPNPPDRGLFQFNATDYFVYENASCVTLNVERYGGSKGAASIELKYIDVSAASGVNYEAVNTTLDFADGEASKAVSIPVKDDGPDNGDKAFQAWLMNPAGGASLGYPVMATVTVKDVASEYRMVKYVLNLAPGWNLVSYPVVNVTLQASSLNGTGVQTVSAYNMTTGDYDSYLMNISPSEYDVTMKTDVGFFVYSSEYTSIIIYGPAPRDRSVTVYPGWNLIGWSSFTSSTAKAVCAEPLLSGSQTISRYNATTGDYDSYIEGISPDEYDFSMHDGAGYFVNTASATPQTLRFEVI